MRKTKKKYLITVPLLTDHITKELAEKTNLAVDTNNRIIINNVVVDSIFSRHERKLIRHLIACRKTLVSRNRVAEIVWNNDTERYSDWALDQLMRRLRNKLQKLGLRKNVIQTKKNQGFLFNQ